MTLFNPNKLVGLTIEAVGTLEKDELDTLGWYHESAPVVLRLNNGSWLLVARDEELNGPGELFLLTKKDMKLVYWNRDDFIPVV